MVDKYALVKTLFNEFNVSKSRIINLIGIKKSSYYYWVKEVKTQRDIENKILYNIIKSIWQDSRRIISHKVGKFMDIKLVIDTLKMAIYKRGDITDLIIHTDRGSQYMSKEYRKFCAKKGISISYSRKGNPYDNACIETFHTTLKKEYVHNENFENLESLRSGMYEYIEIWYNNSRIHSKIGFTSPNEYEESIKKGNKEIA